MYESLVTILALVGLSGLLIAALIFLTKSWITERLRNAIKHEYDQKLETHKAQLKGDHDTAVERLRAELRFDAFQQETRFADLHARRAETIAEMFAALRKFHSMARRYVA